jgi:hypothetical protein
LAWQQPSVDLVAGGITGDGRADLLDDPGVVAAQDDRELIGEHGLEVAGGDAGVDRVDRGGLDPDEQLAGADLGVGRSSRSPGGRSKLSRVKARISRVLSSHPWMAYRSDTIGPSTI